MSFSSEAFQKKLSVLQDTQESIVSISQWVLFHHRNSKDSARIWSEYLLNIPVASSTSSAKRLSLLYLCNDVVQRARRKKKTEFIDEFAASLPSVLKNTYHTLDSSTKPKVDRLLSVWEERSVFSLPDIEKMKKGIQESKTEAPTPTKPSVGGSARIAPELVHLNDLLLKLNQVADVSQANLTQFGIQSKTYLPHDPSQSENLPAPKAYISKLNMLEKLSKVSVDNIVELKSLKAQAAKALENLTKILSEGAKTDDTKLSIINEKLGRLQTTRQELREMVNETNQEGDDAAEDEEEEVSPAYETNDIDDDDDDDLLPTYENDDDEETTEPVPTPENPKKRRSSQTPSGGSTPSKRVAFSEDIEVKEFDREEDDFNDYTEDDSNGYGDKILSVSFDFTKHHKDDIELKHDHESATDDDDGYDPSSGYESNNKSDTESTSDIMSLLSKLS